MLPKSANRVELAKLHDQLDATMIYVTHDQTEAMTMADEIVVLDQVSFHNLVVRWSFTITQVIYL